jgi:iron complex outermembrane receptor protein
MRIGGGVYWRDGTWFARVGLLHAFAQNHPGENETPTPGYNLLKAELSYTRKLLPNFLGFREVTVGVTGTNLLDDVMRNSVSFRKDEVVLPGRSFRLFANARF